ncbi:hypothetical protein Klosneuvirus_6_105 [Klosneuvirus KNV1]|uniref:Uncharacterized protein n=1 Tax=Klosneuvirus KNV1 TaxID=1977640 RepID=A0A1V0SLF4_9VIRU|nr:hypothetical protein Klosneuvirus_6_105 [Klosneuvirus KNV1]
MNKKRKKHHSESSIDPNYRLPIAHPFHDFMNMKHTTFPSTAYEAGAINISPTIELNKSSVINKPDPEFYQKYYEVKIDKDKHKKIHQSRHHHKHSHKHAELTQSNKKSNTIE